MHKNKSFLLKTIRIPKDLQSLSNRLPRKNYHDFNYFPNEK